jgi:hypothetical protein
LQLGEAQVGALQLGELQLGASQFGVSQVGALQVGVFQVGAVQVSFFQIGALAQNKRLHRLHSNAFHIAPTVLDGTSFGIGSRYLHRFEIILRNRIVLDHGGIQRAMGGSW